jgi:UDPglucose--hexose-1-phosphate uridylyltransferase
MDASKSHRRYNPLLDEWVLVSPHRTQRPWLGQEEPPVPARPSYDPGCYLCPGNTRANGEKNPEYPGTFVFQNDFAALTQQEFSSAEDDLYRAESASGECRVICFSPRHDLTLASMSIHDIRKVVDLWGEQTSELFSRYKYVQIFENKGEVMGCSNPHPHGQIWASDFVPSLVQKEAENQRSYLYKNHQQMLYKVLEKEQEAERKVVENEYWLCFVPFWATWPFETLLLPKQYCGRLSELSEAQKDALADILKQLLVSYDNLFSTSFPYSMGWHQAPNGYEDSFWLHAHFYPPLLRSASVKKFMVGYEMLAEPQRDLTPEQAAARLRERL